MPNIADLPNEDPQSVKFPCFKISQPVGDFFVGVMPWNILLKISRFDVRRIIEEARPVETYLGIQRPLQPERVEELKEYVMYRDASFPTGIVIAVESDCAAFNDQTQTMTLMNKMDVESRADRVFLQDVARVIDGQHRIAGLEGFRGEKFDLPVIVLVGMDIADQAYVFSTVNLAQTKVNASLAYDLYALAKTRSPQKTCHNIAVAMDQHEKSPFFKMIKRLGVATEGRFNETITQATFIRALIPYMSNNPLADRDQLLRGNKLSKVNKSESSKFIFRNMFIEEQDLKIMDVVWNYFSAIKERWPTAWGNTALGNILNRTNGFRAFMRWLRPAYLFVSSPGNVPTKEQFSHLMQRITLGDDDFTVERFKPGTSGEALLLQTLIAQTNVPVN
jgi:DGQHR domain-containing protein